MFEGLTKSSEENDTACYLQNNFKIKLIKCEQLTICVEAYKAFKISVNAVNSDDRDTSLNPEIQPFEARILKCYDP